MSSENLCERKSAGPTPCRDNFSCDEVFGLGTYWQPPYSWGLTEVGLKRPLDGSLKARAREKEDQGEEIWNIWQLFIQIVIM